MTTSSSQTSLPRLRPELTPRPMGGEGRYVVKDGASGAYFEIGEQECFLFRELDGQQDAAAICAAFEQKFGEPLSGDDLSQLVEMGLAKGLLTHGDASPSKARPAAKGWLRGQNPLYFRLRLIDPDRLLDWLAPKLWFIWTWGFLVVSALGIALAAGIAVLNRHEWISMFPSTLTWQTVLLLWALICVVTTLHEFAHGLTCKHFGGEVREIGFLMLFFMPCLYCNVSDAWLLRERWKRLWVGAAGTYWDLCVWACATLAWRLTLQDTTLNYLAWVLSSLTLARCLLNLNPLIKLDGYYLLGDCLEISNLSERGANRFETVVHWLAWGARRPESEPRAWVLLLYGFFSWVFLFTVILAILGGFFRLPKDAWSAFRFVTSLILFWLIAKGLFRGITGGEFVKMFKHRRLRAAAWVAAIVIIPCLVGLIPVSDRSSGTFQVRPATRVEICAAEAGFLREVTLAEGSEVSPGTPLAQIHIPDLEVNISKKQAEVRESQANLRKLEAGPRPEEVVEQRKRVARAAEWRDLAKRDLDKARQSHREDLRRLERQIELYSVSLTRNRESLAHAERLFRQRALSGEQYADEKTKATMAALELEQSQSQRAAREALGVSVAEGELARREKELADQEAVLKLLEAGSRGEEIEAEQARLARLSEELKYLEGMQSRVVLCSPVSGLITTPRMHEKNGQFIEKGKLVCVIEDLHDLVAEISIKEEDEFQIQSGQTVELRPRAMPFHSFRSQVERKAPSAVLATGTTQATVTVYCRVVDSEVEVLSGMTGLARIHCGYKPLGLVVLNRAMRYLRTEFWL